MLIKCIRQTILQKVNLQKRYSVLKESSTKSLVSIDLYTGRKNQIRVHFSDIGNPVVGDKTYGKAEPNIIDYVYIRLIAFNHPYSKEKMLFSTRCHIILLVW
jgi:tRNA pseudouridine32 synthase/23S rRNA pseudouridine746 synthase/23S rRNA pseudouridine1911/1915/1917 synthase